MTNSTTNAYKGFTSIYPWSQKANIISRRPAHWCSIMSWISATFSEKQLVEILHSAEVGGQSWGRFMMGERIKVLTAVWALTVNYIAIANLGDPEASALCISVVCLNVDGRGHGGRHASLDSYSKIGRLMCPLHAGPSMNKVGSFILMF